MRLTPLDIRKQEFKRSMRGLDIDEVRAFLATVADEYEAVINDNKALRERLLELDDKVQEYRNMEKTLRDTLLTAERVTVEAKENARREAELIVKEAQIEAERAGRDVRTSALKLRQEIQTLKQQKEGYLSRLRVLIESHMKFVEAAERDMGEEERRLESEQREFESTRTLASLRESDMREPESKRPRPAPPAHDKTDFDPKRPPVAASGSGPRDFEPKPEPVSEPEMPGLPGAADHLAEEGPGGERPAFDRAPEPRGRKDAEASPAPDWSLDRLKRDILAGTARTDEEDR